MTREDFLTKRLAERGEELEQAKAKIERLKARIETGLRERDSERKWFNDAIARHLAEVERLKAENKTYRDGIERAAEEAQIVCDRLDKQDFGSELAAWLRRLPDDQSLPHPESPKP